jgi:phosphatidylserine decarboxylase
MSTTESERMCNIPKRLQSDEREAGLCDYRAALPQYLLPQRLLSRAAHAPTRWSSPWIKNRLIRWFVRHYQVDMLQAAEPDPGAYPSFNAFFTRALAPGARPLPQDPAWIVCPADGVISALGHIDDTRLLQAKGHYFDLVALLGGNAERAEPFRNGCFVTVYLSPRDYHRVHMPLAGRLREMVHVPGRLFSVNASTSRVVPSLYARNERLVCLFDTAVGPMALVLVGAIFVGSMQTVWAGEVTPPYGHQVVTTRYDGADIRLARGAELGRFNMGSTVIVLFPRDRITWADERLPGWPVRMGQPLAVT